MLAALLFGLAAPPALPAPRISVFDARLSGPQTQTLNDASFPRTPEGEIYGRVTDAAGRNLEGVLVIASGPALLQPRSTRTSTTGAYRIGALPPGSYAVRFQMSGRPGVERRGIAVESGFHARVTVQLGLDRAVEERAAAVPALLVDAKSADVAFGVTREWLESMPSRPGLAAFIDAFPGLEKRAARGEERWIDSAALEEVQVRRGTLDSSSPAAGGAPTVVIKSGSSRFSGSARFEFADRRLQADNLTPALRAQGAEFGNPLRRATETSAEAGGPIGRGRGRLWASASRARTEMGIIGFYAPACLDADGSPTPAAPYRADCMRPDLTLTSELHAKLQYQWNPGNRSTLSWSNSSRSNPSRGASSYNRPEATNRQHGLGHARPVQVEHQWVASNSLVLDARYAASDAGFILDFHQPGLAGVQAAYDRHTLVNWRSGSQSRQLRPRTEIRADASILLADSAGGEHALTLGAAALDSRTGQFDRAGGGAVAIFDSRTGSQLPWQARIVRDGQSQHAARRWSAFLQDAFRRGPVTLNVGARFDRQDDRALTASIAANQLLPDLLPAVLFPGADSGVVYDDFSPRVGLALSLGAKTIMKAGVGRYHASGNDTSTRLQPTRSTRLLYWWNDADGDRFVQRDELDFGRGFAATPTPNYDPVNPGAVTTPARVDRSLKNVASDEYSIGFERQIGRSLVVRASYTARRTYRLQASFPVESDGSLVRSDTFYAAQWTPASCPSGARCPTVTYYRRDTPLPSATLLRNDDEHRWRQGADVVAHKRLSDGWMLDVSLSWNRSAWYFPEATRDYTDPTNIGMWNGREYGTAEAHWAATMSGSARLPWGFGASAILSGRQGFPFDRVVSSPNRGALGSTAVSIAPYGRERYPPAWRLDCRFDWKGSRRRIEVVPAIDVLNAFNSNVVLARNRVQNSQTANNVTQIAAPRSVSLGVRVGW